MNNDGGTITVTLKLDDSKFKTAARQADSTGKELSEKLDSNTKAATDRTAARFASLGTAIRTGLGLGAIAATAAGVASIKMAGDFEQSLSVLKSVSGATGKEMDLLAQKARELGQDAALPGISAKDAAFAMVELAKAGVSVNDTLTASKGVLSLAKAGNIEVAEAATIAARALNAFGLKGSEASKVADILAAGANASSADVDEMALALSQAGSSASRMGLDLDDTVTALGLFSNAGINGSDAGTSLKTALARFVPTSKEASKAMQELGLNFFDSQGKFIGLRDSAEQLRKKLAPLTQEQRELAINTIFGSDASRAAGILANEGAKGFDSMSKAVNRQGAATDLAKAQNSGFNGALDNLLSTLETLGTDLGTKVLPPLTDFLRILAQVLPPAVQWIIDNGKLLSIVIIGLGSAFATIRVAGFISDLAKAQKTLALFIGAKNANGVSALGSAIRGAGQAAAKGWQAVKFAGSWLVELAKITAGALKTAAVATAQAIKTAAVWVAQAARAGAAWLVQFGFMIARAVIAGVAMLVPIVIAGAGMIATAVGVGLAWLAAFWPIILIVAAVAAAVFLVIKYWEPIKGFFIKIGQIISKAFQGVVDWVKKNWPLLLAILTGPIGLAVLWIIKNWDKIKAVTAILVQNIKNFFGGAKDFIVNAFTKAVNFVKGLPGKIVSALGNMGKLLYNKGKDLIQGLLNGAGSLLSKIGQFFLDKLPAPIRGAFKKALGINSPSKVFAGYGKNIVQGLAIGLKNNAGMAGRAALGLADQVNSINSTLSTGSIGVDTSGAATIQGGNSGGINQTNNIYNQVDLEQVNRELAWQVRR